MTALLPSAIYVQAPNTLEARYRFGTFELDVRRRSLHEEGHEVRLGSRAFDLLTVLLIHAGVQMERRTLMSAVWPDTVVLDANLNVHIAALRRALGDGQEGRRYIINTPGRGYTFVGQVEVLSPSLPEPVPAEEMRVEHTSRLHNFPSMRPRLIGRRSAVAQAMEGLSATRLLTLIGPGGIGKTAVALEVAELLLSEYADGVWLVDLAPVSHGVNVPTALAAVLGLGVRTEAPHQALVAALQARRLLLVLDNCEHVLEAAATLASAIQNGAPSVDLLCTSREALRIEGERLQRIAPLEWPRAEGGLTSRQAMLSPAVQLFVERASAARKDAFTLADDAAVHVAALCKRVDGLPLAIELAAAQAEELGVQEIVRLLDNKVRAMTGGKQSALPRHQTLQAALDWSVQLLDGAQQAALRRLAVFADSFTAEAAARVTSTTPEDLVSLSDRSLLSCEVGDGNVRFRLLQTTRLYALLRLEQEDVPEDWQRRHVEHWVEQLEGSDAVRRSATDQVDGGFSKDLENIRAALDWAFSSSKDSVLALRLAAASAPLWMQQSLLIECQKWSRLALANLPDRGSTREELVLCAALALSLIYTVGVTEEAIRALKRARALASDALDLDWQLQVFIALSWSSHRCEDFEDSLALAKQVESLATALPPSENREVPLFTAEWLAGVAHFFRGEYDEALPIAQRAIARSLPALGRSHIARWEMEHAISARCTLANTYWVQGRLGRALEVAQSLLSHSLTNSHAVSVCMALTWSGCAVHIRLGKHEAAELAISRLRRCAEENGLSNMLAAADGFEGMLRLEQGLAQRASELLRASLSQLRRGGSMTHYTAFVSDMALALLAAGRSEEASDWAEEGLHRAEAHKVGWWLPEALRVRAVSRTRLTQGADDSAVGMLRRSLMLAEAQGAHSWALRTSMNLAQAVAASGDREGAVSILERALLPFAQELVYPEPKQASVLLERLITTSQGTVD